MDFVIFNGRHRSPSDVAPLLVRTKLVIYVDHRIVVNPLSATPLFSPARAALVGLVVYKPRGRRVAKPKLCRKASLFQAMHHAPPLVSPDLSAMASPTWSRILQTWRVENFLNL
ncbi:hypothetical protein DAPPUDRAFT_232846 [Daphnia pulex]|uniref:Uncharacterized protein n=1 Tax=Daphnia pulex TaxID=6669 RepID=E9FSI2_DAPPU|nr:hypothetical protein DAPPUDRAFT_232846 [Daphnia pulex]|eukprot:EFX89212.1 hypothetical protein DAPPUDRAFT_232846 [Daphnia pulex]